MDITKLGELGIKAYKELKKAHDQMGKYTFYSRTGAVILTQGMIKYGRSAEEMVALYDAVKQSQLKEGVSFYSEDDVAIIATGLAKILAESETIETPETYGESTPYWRSDISP